MHLCQRNKLITHIRMVNSAFIVNCQNCDLIYLKHQYFLYNQTNATVNTSKIVSVNTCPPATNQSLYYVIVMTFIFNYYEHFLLSTYILFHRIFKTTRKLLICIINSRTTGKTNSIVLILVMLISKWISIVNKIIVIKMWRSNLIEIYTSHMAYSSGSYNV